MAWTQTDLDALDAAIATGARRVTYDGHTVEYHSMDDMLKARAMMRRALGKTATAQRKLATFDRGL